MTQNGETVISCSDLSNDMTPKFREILKSNHITEPISELIVQDSGLRGENMASQTKCVIVKFENPTLKPLNLFMKIETSNPSHTEMVEDAKLFEKEALFFMKYIPAAREFCSRMGQEKLMEIYPKCYYGDRKMIVFENLVVDKGYTLLNKQEQQDFEAARLALTTLAIHHAISYAFINSCFGSPEEFFRHFPNLDFEALRQPKAKEMMGPVMETGITTNIKILEKSNIKDKDRYIAELEAQQGKSYSLLLEALEDDPEDKSFRVLNHGDYWNNNMMFLKDGCTNEVTGHIAVDFQVTRYCSPSIDLGYYLFTSVKAPVRQANLEELLKIYFEVLKKTTMDLGQPIELTYEQLMADFRKKSKFGFWFGILVSTGAGYAVLKDMDPNKIEMSEWGTTFNTLIQKWIENNPQETEKNAKTLVGTINEYKTLTK